MNTKKVKKAGETAVFLAGALLLIWLLVWLGILKWILIAVAVLLGLAILLLAAVLLVPVRYRLEAAWDETQEARFRVTWLLHLLSFRGNYQDKRLSWSLRVAGIRLFSSEKKEEAESEPEEAKLEEAKPEEAKAVQTEGSEEKKEPETAAGTSPGKEEKKVRRKEKKSAENKESRKAKLQEKLEQGKEIWTLLRENRAALTRVLGALRCSLCRLLPRSCDLYLRYGLEDPALTGQILGAYWAVRPLWLKPGRSRRHLAVEADFQQKCFCLKGKAAGHFSVAGLLGPLLGALLSQEVRRLYKDFKKAKTSE